VRLPHIDSGRIIKERRERAAALVPFGGLEAKADHQNQHRAVEQGSTKNGAAKAGGGFSDHGHGEHRSRDVERAGRIEEAPSAAVNPSAKYSWSIEICPPATAPEARFRRKRGSAPGSDEGERYVDLVSNEIIAGERPRV
jgi:hypothetical protein